MKSKRPAPFLTLTLALGLLAPALGCGGGDTEGTGGGGGGGGTLAPADTKDFTHAYGVLTATVDVDGQPGRLVPDTGAPFVLLNYFDFVDSQDAATAKKLAVNDGAPLVDVPIVVGGTFNGPDPDVVLNGLLGCEVICRKKISFDYASAAFTFGGAPPPSGTGKTIKVPFELEGGGSLKNDGHKIDYGPSRIIVTADVEGTERKFIVDTGATWSVFRATVFKKLTDDGRPTIAGPDVGTVYANPGSSKLARAASIKVGDAEAKGSLVVSSAVAEEFIDAVADEIGHDIDGSLGGSFFGGFFLSIDYPNKVLELSPYDAGSPLVDRGRTTGIAVSPIPAYDVVQVVDGSAAAEQGVAVGDEVKTIDGKDISTLTGGQMELLATGAAGAKHTIGFGKTKASALTNKTVTFQVRDLLAATPVP